MHCSLACIRTSLDGNIQYMLTPDFSWFYFSSSIYFSFFMPYRTLRCEQLSFHTCNCFQSLDFDELGWTKYTKHKPQLGKDSTANNVSAALPLLRSYKSWRISEIMDFNSIKNSAWSVTWRNSMLKSNQDPGTTVPLEQILCFLHTHLVVHTPLWWSIYHWWWLF